MALIMILALVSACAPQGTQPDTPQPVTPEQPATSDDSSTTEAPPVESGGLPHQELIIFIAGDRPVDEQTVLDEIERRLADTLNVSIKTEYMPWGDYLEQVPMRGAARDVFDIFLNFSFDIFPAYTRGQALDITDLVAEYGKNITANIPEIELLAGMQDGRLVAIPATYPKDSIALTAVVRKDLREKYDVPPITNLDTLEAFYDAIIENEPHMVPLASLAHFSTTFLSGGLRNPQRPTIFTSPNLVMAYLDGDDAFVAQGFHEVIEQTSLMELGAHAFNSGWFERDILAQTEAREMFESGRAASWNVDVFNFTAIETALRANVPEAEMEWVILTEGRPLTYSPSNNFGQVSTTSPDPARAVMFLDWLLADQANYDLYFHGIEGVHFNLTPGGLLEFPDPDNITYDPTPWFLRSAVYHRLSTSEAQATVEAFEFFANAPLLPVQQVQLEFVFDQEPVAAEIAACYTVVASEWYPLLAGVRQGQAAYDQFIDHLYLSGLQAIIDEFQSQLDAWRAANP